MYVHHLLLRALRLIDWTLIGVGSFKPVRIVLGLPRRREILASCVLGWIGSIKRLGVIICCTRILGFRRMANIDWLRVRRRDELDEFCKMKKYI